MQILCHIDVLHIQENRFDRKKRPSFIPRNLFSLRTIQSPNSESVMYAWGVKLLYTGTQRKTLVRLINEPLIVLICRRSSSDYVLPHIVCSGTGGLTLKQHDRRKHRPPGLYFLWMTLRAFSFGQAHRILCSSATSGAP